MRNLITYCLLFAVLMIPCGRCSNMINEGDTYYEKKACSDMSIITHMQAPHFENFYSAEDTICKWC